jgi:hypothetical protein
LLFPLPSIASGNAPLRVKSANSDPFEMPI